MIKITGEELPNIPWQEKPEGCHDVVWRYSGNPIIERDAIPSSNSIFNSAVVPFEGKFAGVFRCDSRSRSMDIFAGFSEDGIHWDIEETPIIFEGADEEILKREYRYDPRKINGMYGMLSRPSDTGHTPFGDIFYSQSPDLEFWGRHRHVMSTIKGDTSAWQSMKIGAGPVPIETSEGWLLFYHGVLNSCNGYVYSFGAALLDLEKPWIVKYRTKPYLLSPQKLYECVGDVPNVTFPCAALADAKTGKIAIYYGCADTVTGLAFAKADELISYIKENSL